MPSLFPEGFGVWARRTLALSDELWPRSTRLEVEGFRGGVQKVARGADLEVVARADTTMPQVPQVVEVRYRTEGGGRGRATMDRRGVARGPEDHSRNMPTRSAACWPTSTSTWSAATTASRPVDSGGR